MITPQWRSAGIGRTKQAAFAAFGALTLAGCASLADSGMDGVKSVVAERIPAEVAVLADAQSSGDAERKLSALLKRTLTADTAVQIALFNNRDLQAAYNALGIAQARRLRASLPANPTFSLSRVAGGGGFELEREVLMNILSLATLPARTEIATDRFRQAQLQAASETVRVALETRRAWTVAVAAASTARFLADAQTGAQAANELSKRLAETGAGNKLDHARNQVFYAETTAELGRARQRAQSARERLVRLMGLSGGDLAFKLPADLPPLPAQPRTLASVEHDALARRIDLQMARIELEALAKSYGLTSATRFINVVEVGGQWNRTREGAGEPTMSQRGIAVELQVPLFDFGEANAREAEQTYMQALNRLTAKAVNVRSEAREAYQAYRVTYSVARQYAKEVLPLRRVISEEMVLRYNAMQIDVFALLTEARARIQSTTAAIEALRDFRLAEANLASAVIGSGGVSAESDSAPAMAAGEAQAGH
jgi:outer membrane protein TolC